MSSPQSVGGITTMSPEVGEALATFPRLLILDGLKSLSPETAAMLAKREGRLSLSGLQPITPEVAAALATYREDLDLAGLRPITPEAALALQRLSHRPLIPRKKRHRFPRAALFRPSQRQPFHPSHACR